MKFWFSVSQQQSSAFKPYGILLSEVKYDMDDDDPNSYEITIETSNCGNGLPLIGVGGAGKYFAFLNYW